MYDRSVNYTFILDMSKILDNIYIWVFLVNSECVRLLAFVTYMFYSHCTENCIFLLLFGSLFCDEKLFEIFFYLCIYFVQKTAKLICRKRPNPSLNRIFNALSIDVQYTLWFQWIYFDLKCLILTNQFFGRGFLRSVLPNRYSFKWNLVTTVCLRVYFID